MLRWCYNERQGTTNVWVQSSGFRNTHLMCLYSQDVSKPWCWCFGLHMTKSRIPEIFSLTCSGWVHIRCRFHLLFSFQRSSRLDGETISAGWNLSLTALAPEISFFTFAFLTSLRLTPLSPRLLSIYRNKSNPFISIYASNAMLYKIKTSIHCFTDKVGIKWKIMVINGGCNHSNDNREVCV